MANTGPSPTTPISTPATAGPVSRAMLNIEEFSAIALARSSGPSTSFTNSDCRAGMSNALTMPSTADSAMMCQTWTVPVRTSAARMDASSERERLRRDDDAVAPVPVRDHTGDRGQQERRELAGEGDRAEERTRSR